MNPDSFKIYYIKEAWWHAKNLNGLLLVKTLENVEVKEWNGENDGMIFSPVIIQNIIDNFDKVIIGPHEGFDKMVNFSRDLQRKKNILQYFI